MTTHPEKRLMHRACPVFTLSIAGLLFAACLVQGQKRKVEVMFPPTLPGDKEVVTDTSESFLKQSGTLQKGVTIAKTPPTVDFLYYPGQIYSGKPWSNWGDSLAVGG